MRNDYYRYIKKNVRIQEVCQKLGIPIYEQGSGMCRCPFHNDNTPSMAIYDDHAYCFACHKRWNNLEFVGEKLDLDFEQQVEWMESNFPEILSQKAKYINSNEKSVYKSGYDLAYSVYANMSEEEELALQGIADTRKFDKEFLVERGIFFAKGRKIRNYYVQEEDENIEEKTKLNKCQLLLRQPWRERSLTDRYEDYYSEDGVIIAIRDRKQNIVGYAQRASGDRKPKYKFTKKLPKKTILYRIDEFEKRLKKEKRDTPIELYLVEGMFDALGLEKLGKYALAVLGSQLTKTQTIELENVLQEKQNSVSIHIFMDGDEAGQRGNLQTLRNLWSRDFFRKSYIDILVPSEQKDPDECIRKEQIGSIKKYSPFEYLVYSNLRDRESEEEGKDTRSCFERLGVEDKIICLSKINHLLPRNYWQDILSIYAMPEDDYFAWKIKEYIGEGDFERSGLLLEKDSSYQFQTALQIASTSYEREALPLDELSWERIQACADAFFVYFKEICQEGRNMNIPLLTMHFPKKLGETRMKSIYVHERLILQQYVLNEMLGEGENGYESYVPAVRYSRRSDRIYTTANSLKETVSFAYQIDMDKLLQGGNYASGMFRDYYGCWKAYIQYIQDGIQKLDSERIYRIKLDIRKFYDSIHQYAVRRAIFPALLKALTADPSKFSVFQSGEQEVNTLAEKVTGWILRELYENKYYSSENGKIVEKEEKLVGIPQGPNLSAYIANIVLFDMDCKIMKVIDKVNEAAAEGTIIIRYARYVDDMIIVSSDAEALLEVKDLISSELYELGLYLSPKTDKEDGISKEEAIAWTTDQKGGLGVSAVFDFPDDTLEDIMDEFDAYEVTDRRSALKLLDSELFVIDKEILLEEAAQERLLGILFQTEEVRFTDMVRMAELLLIKAASKSEMEGSRSIYDEFMELWNQGKKSSSSGSLFQEEGIALFAFIEGCNKVLKRRGDSIRARERFHIWKRAKKAIGHCLQTEFIKIMEGQFQEKEILRKNQWVLKLRLTEIQCRLKAEEIACEGQCTLNQQNEFNCRWKYAFLEKEGGFLRELPSDEVGEKVVEIFHYAASSLSSVSNLQDYRNVQSSVRNGAPHLFVRPDIGILGHCLLDWFQEEGREETEREITKTTFFALLNLLKNDVKAEIIEKLPHYQEYIFHGEKEYRIKYLPVVPGVGYPGMIAETIPMEKTNTIMKRIDFVSSVNENPKDWKKEENNDYPLFSDEPGDGFVCLDTIFDKKDELQIPLVLKIYEELYKSIQEIQTKNPSQSIVLSSKNVFVKKEEKSGQFSMRLYFYLLPKESVGNGVLLEGRTGKFALKILHESGSFFWQAGYLIKDVCHFATLRLKYENGEIAEEKADEIKMMEYTFNRLTGESVNLGNILKSVHSYETSVNRAIRRTECFLSKQEDRDILLEDNAAVDSFISQRMRRENYGYGPAECSYFIAVWAKGYLRNRFDILMALVGKKEERNSKKYLTKRRVPKAYLVLADYIEKLSDRVNGSMESNEDVDGLRVLISGLRSNAALLQLRMQFLELVESFDSMQREKLKKQKEDLPFVVLELEEGQELIVEDCPITEILDNLLDEKNDRRIGKITHVGWLILLEWILEFEKPEASDGEMQILTERIREWIHEILEDTKKDEQTFPFEQMSSLFALWSNDKTEELFELCEQIDKKMGIEVKVRCSEFYYQKRGKVQIILDSGHIEKPEYFLTYSKLDNGWINIEHEDTNPEKRVFSQSVRNGKTVGLSVVEVRLGEMLKRAECQEKLSEEVEKQENVPALENEMGAKEEYHKNEVVQSGESVEREGVALEEGGKEHIESEIQRIEGTEEKVCGNKEENNDTDDFLERIEKWQTESWEQRSNNFVNSDRIALFQFETFDSYHHPNTERCELEHMREKKSQMNEIEYSCQEFRRRKLLEKVLQICHSMEVEILLLPEYSVRPETVAFLRKKMNDNKYRFSIWAGTFRIPWDYQFAQEPFEELVDKKNIFHAAILPVIMPGTKKVYCSRMKKYPSITLKEDINPCAVLDNNFEPVAEQHIPKGKKEYGDARDHVTELICAEVFALSSPGNLLSFADAAFQLFKNYGLKKANFGDYKTKMLEDIQKYGGAISLYREKKDKKRRSIVLVPACTTRATDYYVLGQANYLGSGANMVFCNGAGKLAKGGSCFIGQNSWDDEGNRKKKDIEYGISNIYHGVYPGIYMQTSDMSGRGGLGSGEQALLVCDVTPDLDKRNPNPESMRQSLELVAHIPILEEPVYSKDCIEHCKYREKVFSCEKILNSQDKARQRSKEWIKQIYEVLQEFKEERKTTASDKEPWRIAESLIELGGKYKSSWLKERGMQYLKGHKLFPRNGLPETALDWCYVEIEYQKFIDSDEYFLMVPSPNNAETKKEGPSQFQKIQ